MGHGGLHFDFAFRDPQSRLDEDYVAEFDVALRTCSDVVVAVLREWALARDLDSYYCVPPGDFRPLRDTEEIMDFHDIFPSDLERRQAFEFEAIAAYREWAAQGGPRAIRPSKEEPCDCPGGPCGSVHIVPAGPPQYYLDGREITKAEYRAARAAVQRKAAPAENAP